LFRVAPAPGPGAVFPDTVALTNVGPADGGRFAVSGSVTVRPARAAAQRIYAPEVQVRVDGGQPIGASVADGRWSVQLDRQPSRIEVTSPFGGVAEWNRVQPETMATLAVTHRASALPRFNVQSKRRVGVAR
jgi:hypothetical protein